MFLLIATTSVTLGQLKSLDRKKYFDCIAHIDIELEKPKKYFEESKKYLNTEFIIVTTDNRNKIIDIERGFVKNSATNNKKSIWFESKSIKDTLKMKYSISLREDKNTYYYFADCFDTK